MRITRTYPKAVFYAPSANAVTTADWAIPNRIFIIPVAPVTYDSWGVSWAPSWGISWVH